MVNEEYWGAKRVSPRTGQQEGLPSEDRPLVRVGSGLQAAQPAAAPGLSQGTCGRLGEARTERGLGMMKKRMVKRKRKRERERRMDRRKEKRRPRRLLGLPPRTQTACVPCRSATGNHSFSPGSWGPAVHGPQRPEVSHLRAQGREINLIYIFTGFLDISFLYVVSLDPSWRENLQL